MGISFLDFKALIIEHQKDELKSAQKRLNDIFVSYNKNKKGQEPIRNEIQTLGDELQSPRVMVTIKNNDGKIE